LESGDWGLAWRPRNGDLERNLTGGLGLDWRFGIGEKIESIEDWVWLEDKGIEWVRESGY
jgi:hypothetical protein